MEPSDLHCQTDSLETYICDARVVNFQATLARAASVVCAYTLFSCHWQPPRHS